MNIKSPETMMFNHGKSFYFASQVFSKKIFIRISYLYAFCRFVDDTADEQSPETALSELKFISNQISEMPQTVNGLEDSPFSNNVSKNSCNDLSKLPTSHIPSKTKIQISLTELILKLNHYGVENTHLLVLTEGALFDVEQNVIQTKSQLIQYCYMVAGVVGQMMCPLIQVQDKKAKPFAIDLGIGMQLTNICRDVLEDAKNGRTYLPLEDLNSKQLNILTLSQLGQTPIELRNLIKKYLHLADVYYQSSFHGLAYIPLRPRIAILLASNIYRSIGLKIKKNNYDVLKGRVFLTTSEKVWVSFKSLIKMLHLRFWFAGTHHTILHEDLKSIKGLNL